MPGSSTDAITIHGLTKRFGDFLAVDGVSFSVKKGEIFGFLGANGSGKSTTIRMLCGILTPSSGRGKVAGHDIFGAPEKIKQSIGYMSQKFSLYMDLTPVENIRFYLGAYNIPDGNWPERMDWAMELTRLHEYKTRRTSELAPGLRQRLALGCALLHKPDILFLDEPTSGVDPLTRRHFWNFIKDLSRDGITAFVTTHYMDEAMHCQRLALINEGKIVVLGRPRDLIQKTFPDDDKANLSDVFIQLMSRRGS
jgi:ABC-2 type transport system ATP-binding protein